VAYATGKFARGLCDRCGFEYKLHELKEEWNNLKVCSECFEPKAPQIDPRPVITDPEAVYNPRPNNDKEVGEGFVVVSDANNFTIKKLVRDLWLYQMQTILRLQA